MSHYRTLLELTRSHRRRYAAAVLAMALSNVFLFAPPLISRAAIDGALGEGAGADSRIAGWLLALTGEGDPLRTFALAGLAIVAFTLVGGVFLYFRGRWAATASEAIARDLRDRVYSHLDRLPCEYHDRADTGDLVQRATSDVETVRVFLAGQVVEIGRAALLLLTVVPVLVSLDGRMTLASLALFPIIITFAVMFFRRIQRLFLATDEAEGAMTSVLQENLTGIRVVRAFARQDFEEEKFAARNGRFRDLNYQLIRFLGSYWAASDFLCVTQIGLALGYGAMRLQDGTLSAGTLFAFLTYQGMVIWPVRHLGRVLTDTGKALVALGRLGEILNEPEERDSAGATSFGEEAGAVRIRGAIEVERLTFAHGDAEPALRDLSFRVEAGETLALIGPPGSGKSTLIHLLLRIYDYTEGSIRLDGRELRDWPRRLVRSAFGTVMQEPFLYSRTIGANVRVGRTEATLEDVVEAATAADIHGAIEDFDRGYETLVGERGVTLSGGQRQRLAIARALVSSPPVLVLDDALSAVDTGTEARILEALEERHGRSTTIVIAHRLSSVRHADLILVLDHGAVVQSGTHGELAAAEGPYRRLWEIQGALETEIESDMVRIARTGEE